MSRRWLLGSVLLWLLFALSGAIGDYAMAQELCADARKNLRQEQRRLNDYLSALEASYDNRDFKLARVLNFKISQAKRKLHELELIIKYCPSQRSSLPADGMRGAKSDSARYADKSCIELRKMVFPLLVSKRALERREKSLFSKLTDEEAAEFLEVSDKLREVRKALITKCSTKRNRRSLLKQLRR
jgi:hypothetical protein